MTTLAKATQTLTAQIKRVQALGVPYITYEGVKCEASHD